MNDRWSHRAPGRRHRAWAAWSPRAAALALAALLCPACGSAAHSGDALRAARALVSNMEETEERAEELTRGLTEALTAPAESPDAALERLAVYIGDNVDEMNAVAAAVVLRLESLEGDEERAYLEVLADKMSEPTFAWRDAFFGFAESNPELADRLIEVTAPLGHQIPPVQRPF